MGPLNDPGVAIVGCGLIGRKRAAALGTARLVAVADVDLSRASALTASCAEPVDVTTDWQTILGRSDVHVVIVATTNESLAPIAAAAAAAGKHVLVEKPAARSAAELETITRAARASGALVRVGFNHRYHPAIRRALEMQRAGAIGGLMFLRARYGHGGRLGYEREWRADPARSGGGELIDQGVHIIDLSRAFLGDIAHVSGWAHTFFWDMPVDDNAFVLLRTADDRAACFHVSCSEWKNLFCMEVYGRSGKLRVDGLGGSYGTERLTYYEMKPDLLPPVATTWDFPAGDVSWQAEFDDFLVDIATNRTPTPGLRDAAAALEIVERIYGESGYHGGR